MRDIRTFSLRLVGMILVIFLGAGCTPAPAVIVPPSPSPTQIPPAPSSTNTPAPTETLSPTGTPTPRPTVTPLGGAAYDLISYISDKSGSPEIYLLSLDKTYALQLTKNNLVEKDIYWAPNAQKLLFTACPHDNCDFYIMDANGSNGTQLTHAELDGFTYSEPCWSPDSKQIAFVGKLGNEKQIFIMDADGSNRRLLTKTGTYNLTPAWSPDGARIAYASNAFGDYDIINVNTDGTNPIQVTNNDYDDSNPVWAFDSTKIAFLTLVDQQKGKTLFLANADGTNTHDISAGITEIRDDVAWSPTNNSIAFSASPARRNYEIYGVWADNWGGTQYSVNKLNNHGPSWAPDGKRLVFITRDGDFTEVFFNAGGTMNFHQLTDDKAHVTAVAWVPIKPKNP